MTSSLRVLLTALLISCVPLSALCAEPNAQSWFLPQILTDENTTISFELDTTWHTVHGTSSDIKGRAWLTDEHDPHSVAVEIDLPASKLDTGSSSRDEEMREVLAAESAPLIQFRASRLAGKCSPSSMSEKTRCDDSLIARLKIRTTELPVTVPVTIEKTERGFVVEGSLPLKWADYGVEDPSILIARVDPIVTVSFRVSLGRHEPSLGPG